MSEISAGPTNSSSAPGGRVIVVGSVNADWVVNVPALPVPGETVLGAEIAQHHGGKGANQAVAAAAAGAPVAIIGAVGDDALADGELAALDAARVDRRHVQRLAAAPTGLAMITVDARGENQIVVAPGANARLDAAQVRRALQELAPVPRDVILISLEVEDGAVAAAIEAGAAAGARVLLNPAPMRPLVPAAVGRLTVLTPNRPEVLALADTGREVEPAASALADATGAAVLVTLGAEGALLAFPGESQLARIPAPRGEAIDTVGAGDVFNGTLAARLASGDELRVAAQAAVAAATASTRWPGPRPPA